MNNQKTNVLEDFLENTKFGALSEYRAYLTEIDCPERYDELLELHSDLFDEKGVHIGLKAQAQMNETCYNLRYLMNNDVLRILDTGDKPNILALKEQLLSYIELIDCAEDMPDKKEQLL